MHTHTHTRTFTHTHTHIHPSYFHELFFPHCTCTHIDMHEHAHTYRLHTSIFSSFLESLAVLQVTHTYSLAHTYTYMHLPAQILTYTHPSYLHELFFRVRTEMHTQIVFFFFINENQTYFLKKKPCFPYIYLNKNICVQQVLHLFCNIKATL